MHLIIYSVVPRQDIGRQNVDKVIQQIERENALSSAQSSNLNEYHEFLASKMIRYHELIEFCGFKARYFLEEGEPVKIIKKYAVPARNIGRHVITQIIKNHDNPKACIDIIKRADRRLSGVIKDFIRETNQGYIIEEDVPPIVQKIIRSAYPNI